MTNLGPAPTNFELPSSCVEDLQSAYWYHLAASTGWFLVQGPEEQTTCYPSGYAALSLNQIYYSPGRCPTGFTPACEAHQAVGSLTETIVTCCPTQNVYSCQTNPSDKYPWQYTLGCVSTVQSESVYTFNSVSGGVTYLKTSTLVSSNGFNAYSVQIRYQSTDFVATTTSTNTISTGSTWATAISAIRPTNPHDSSSNINDAKSTDNISAGAAAGIAIGAFTGLLIAIAGVSYLLWRKKRQRRALRRVAELQGQPNHGPLSHHLGKNPGQYEPWRAEKLGHGQLVISELVGGPPAANELNGQPLLNELEAK
ncbi:hypothetical protein F5B22DRAFT_601512 [Xylaria bambusicola]|uniref:uncharacterized protein n=1 Tax=Xylaria bambusicola TaxID=326684 RepID=UPI002007FF2F|nr:uncharacterized protein F5B22DRAFT_601512 [Xylaria bambusicola]KAI0518047.1 hypothetical protein F5B22DRAFT_601512 [Xylaria bambusicola]